MAQLQDLLKYQFLTPTPAPPPKKSVQQAGGGARESMLPSALTIQPSWENNPQPPSSLTTTQFTDETRGGQWGGGAMAVTRARCFTCLGG